MLERDDIEDTGASGSGARPAQLTPPNGQKEIQPPLPPPPGHLWQQPLLLRRGHNPLFLLPPLWQSPPYLGKRLWLLF